MKRIFTSVLLIFIILPGTVLSGCKQSGSDGKINIVCTVFPQYDWVRQILGENAADLETELLLDRKIDMHSYQPSVEDIAKISACDLFIYIGGESEKWVEDVLKEAANDNMIVINLIDALGDAVKTEEIIEGMEGEHDHEDEHSGEGEHDHEEEHDHGHGEAEYDEHIWLSLKNTQILCSVITGAITSLDSVNAEKYQNNSTAYIEKLSSLDSEYQKAADTAQSKVLLFGDRFPFRYLVDDYGLDYYAAFAGCSAETEASFDTVIFLAEKLDELNLKNILVTENSDQSIAETIRDNSKNKSREILVLDSMQSVTAEDVKNGTTYLSVMESNLAVLKNALGQGGNV